MEMSLGASIHAIIYIYILVGGCEHLDHFSIYWECRDPN